MVEFELVEPTANDETETTRDSRLDLIATDIRDWPILPELYQAKRTIEEFEDAAAKSTFRKELHQFNG